MKLQNEYHWEGDNNNSRLVPTRKEGNPRIIAYAKGTRFTIFGISINPDVKCVKCGNCTSINDGKRQVEDHLREQGILIDDEPEVGWRRNKTRKYETDGDFEHCTVTACDNGKWVIYESLESFDLITEGQAVDIATAKACCIAYCKQHKLHMFAEPEPRSEHDKLIDVIQELAERVKLIDVIQDMVEEKVGVTKIVGKPHSCSSNIQWNM